MSIGQDCDKSFTGHLIDASTEKNISFATVYIKELKRAQLSDSLGFFRFENICLDEFHVAVSHISYSTEEFFVNILKKDHVHINMMSNSQLIHHVPVFGNSESSTIQMSESMDSDRIAQNSDKNLANLLDNMAGISTIKNGSSIAKPVVHGLYGNRITILNNGIAQGGQQWGVDHSPAIDPLVAKRISVIKGVGAIQYPGNSLGSVILIEPRKIKKDPHVHGEGRYFFESNGRANALSLDVSKYGKRIAWRVIGSLKKGGDKKTADYFLRNTGNQEANLAIQLEKSWNEKFESHLYYSSFNAEYGVLRGSHIGNLTDLNDALSRDEPFYTEEDFSYRIESPRQTVNHQLFKLDTKYFINDNQWLKIVYAGQHNLRKEFDVRRSGRSDIPAMSLKQITHFTELKYQNNLTNNWRFKSGIQFNRVDNVNIPETGILPLIPDYIARETGLYCILSKRLKKTSFELGARYDFERRNIAAISTGSPREIIRYQNEFDNLSAILGISRNFRESWKVTYNIGLASRNPEINELYSSGLHQGVSGIEEGDPNLKQENSLKNTLSITGDFSDKFSIDGLLYHQTIEDFIYLQPQDEIRLTIRGAFPVFKYEQVNSELIGFDLSSKINLNENFSIIGKYSFLRGWDKENDMPLIYMPSNNLRGVFIYKVPKIGKLQNVEFQWNNKYVFEQKNILPDQDFVEAPSSYFLMGVNFFGEVQVSKVLMKISLKVENMLNESYRDILNKQRYFADDLGVNFIAGLNFSF